MRVGVIGTGAIGTAHARRLAAIAGTTVTAVTDLDATRASGVAADLGAAFVEDPGELIRSADVDGVVVASPGSTHAGYVLDAFAAEKPVFCEKPLATEIPDAEAIVAAETSVGRRLLQLGFMRRFDPAYGDVRAAVDEGRIGTPLMAHMVHRNAEVPPGMGSDEVINETLAHEIDISRWLFTSEVESVSHHEAISNPNAPDGLVDPSVLVMHLDSGALVLAEAFVSAGFAYDVRCEVVGSSGSVHLTTRRRAPIASAGRVSEQVPMTWEDRFGEAYMAELRAWVSSVEAGVASGPSAWDGYAATVVAATGIACAAAGGQRTPVHMMDKPALYT